MLLPPVSPVVVDGIVSEEKLRELLGFQSEYHNLDYKAACDLSQAKVRLGLVKDFGAMQVHGGYIVIGVNGRGEPTGHFDPSVARQFDEANLRNTACRHLPPTISLATQVHDVAGRWVVLICVGRHPSGLAIFHSDGRYTDEHGRERFIFRQGEMFTRTGTQSARLSQQEFEGIIDRLVEERLAVLRREEASRMYEAARSGFRGEAVAAGPIDAVSFDLDLETLESAVVELLRRHDRPGLLRLLSRALPEARRIFGTDQWEPEMSQLLDGLATIGATFIELEEDEWFERLAARLIEIYGIGLESDFNFEHNVRFPPGMAEPRLWLLVILRVYAVGALAIRRRRWSLVRSLAVRRDPRMWHRYYWLRHALTMASRGGQLDETQQRHKLSLLNLARQVVAEIPAVHPGVEPQAESLLDDLAQFDLLGNVAMLDAAPEPSEGVIYPNFARFYSQRIEPAATGLVSDPAMRRALFQGDDAQLASAFRIIAHVASQEGARYAGFSGYGDTVEEWLRDHP